jgi:small-conductance mechanosensitive channel
MDTLRSLLHEPLVLHALKAVVVWLLYLGTSFAARHLLLRIGRSQGHDRDRIRGMLTTVRATLRLCFLLLLLVVIGVDFDQIPVYLGSLLTVIGMAFFATWSVLSNVTAGVILFATRDLGMGDRIRIVDGAGTIEGRIIEFRLWAMVLRCDDGTKVLYPNNLAIQKPIVRLASSDSGTTTMAVPPPAAGGA